jgi:hypothetical protein
MAELHITTTVKFEVKATLTENETRALIAISLYGVDSFLKLFYEKMGQSELQPYENDFKELFTKIGKLKEPIQNINEARKKLGLEAKLK